MTNADHLQPSLRRAFDRLARSGEYPKTPDSSRSIRIGMDYPLQVVLSQAIESDEVADAVAWVYCRLGNLQQADPPGDPPASCAAQRAAERARPRYSRAYHLLNSIVTAQQNGRNTAGPYRPWRQRP